MLLSILLVVGTVNAINFVDGLDGLASGMVCIGAFAFFVFSYRLADANNETLAITAALLCACLAGACVGFLPHNFYPARIFMGDSGSMLLGLVLSGSTLTLTGQFAGVQMNRRGGERRQRAGVPAARCCCRSRSWWCRSWTCCWRSSGGPGAGQMFYQPDKEHLHHRLLEFGHSQRRAVVIMWLWAGLIGFGAVLVSLYATPLTVLALAIWACVTAVLTFVVPRLHSPGSRAGSDPFSARFQQRRESVLVFTSTHRRAAR